MPAFKPSKYVSVLSSIKDINNDLDNLTSQVEIIASKFSLKKPQKATMKQETYKRNYHEPAKRKSVNMVASDEDELNDRDNIGQETFGRMKKMMTVGTQGFGDDREIQTSKVFSD